jgi:hypothetical protein
VCEGVRGGGTDRERRNVASVMADNVNERLPVPYEAIDDGDRSG